MKLFFEFVPLLLFFGAILKYDIYVATIVLMIALTVQVSVLWLMFKSVDKMHFITLAVVLIFGSATLAFEDPIFIKWKPTIVNGVFAAAFLLSQPITKKPLVQLMLGDKLELPDTVWSKLNLSWVCFFIFLGGTNLYVVYNFDDLVWAQFKVFGSLLLTLAFVIGQVLYISKYISSEGSENE